ncbi:MAG: hypothetical protein PHC88_16675 [Terrimicrobiaceae bacterium]|nr:hypothetical protein [Terrimicrobiaceae bacterium]
MEWNLVHSQYRNALERTRLTSLPIFSPPKKTVPPRQKRMVYAASIFDTRRFLLPAVTQIDTNAHFIVATLPAGSTPGLYNVWVQNQSGWSPCSKMNAPRPIFMSDYQAHNGTDIEVASIR